ncbi:MAG: metalloregulator ArsR/SmtB family transcription factor [Planctomycetota bacterium]|nr:metalloregulator ArsR/SmtB family transcription factor [Planctomycetota bacterium]
MLDADFVKIAKALADPTRRQMIARLHELGSMNCSQVVENFPLSQPTISHHIKTLESAGLVSVRRDGQFHILSLEETRLAEFASQVLPQSPASKPRRGNETKP